MSWIKNLAVMLASVLVTLLLAEGVLWATGSYSDLANSDLKPSNTVWTRPQGAHELREHPDLKHRVSVIYDDLGVRNHSGKRLTEFTHAIGFFGDSFTENRRMEDEFSLTSQLNQLWGESRAINFGVEGFGLEQSLQRWLNFRSVVRMEDVVYVFCANDLRNLYEVELFTLDTSSGQLQLINRYENAAPSLKRKLYRFLGKFRLTYLVMKGYYQLRGRLMQAHELGQSFSDAHLNAAADAQKTRFRDEYAESMALDLLSPQPSANTLAWAKKFRVVLQWWKQRVEADGARFHIAVIAPPERRLLPLLLGDTQNQYRIVDLKTDAMPAVLRRYSPVFKNDGHWDEIGNLATVPVLADYFARFGSRAYSDAEKEAFLRERLAKILAFYRSHGGEPNLAGMGKDAASRNRAARATQPRRLEKSERLAFAR